MNVKEIQAAVLPGAAGKRRKGEETGGAEFQKILEQAHLMEKAGEPMNSERARGTAKGGILPDSFPAVSGLSFTTPPSGASEAQEQGAVAADRALAMLERYQAFMADGSRPLGKISPIIHSLSAQMQALLASGENLPPSDPLRKIITEVAVLSSVEIEKFNRGDYS